MEFDKKELSEDDVRTKYIDPAIEKAGWNMESLSGTGVVRENYPIKKGKIIIKGNICEREEEGRADYVLFQKPGVPIAVVEAKTFNDKPETGLQQAQEYADHLDVPFVFSSNGEEFVFYNKTSSFEVQSNLNLNSFPSPNELWNQFKKWKKLDDKQSQNYMTELYYDPDKEPRAYQLKAINKTIDAIIKGQKRILLVMATGTGKTYTVFNIIWKLWKGNLKKRILFLTDRNFLIDQTKINDFKPFGKAMTKITGRKVDKAYEIYLSLYHQLTGPLEKQKIYKKFSRDFFDLIVIDECHRGSVQEDSEWRDILEYFSSATQIGMTATPRETKYQSNISYFGEPIFLYTLKNGIEDGYSAPCRVIALDIDKDKGWIPVKGLKDVKGEKIKIKKYNRLDHDRSIVLKKRRKTVAERITNYLRSTDRYQKTIIFCEDVEHAGDMRKHLVNLNSDITKSASKYVMKITGDDKEGKKQIDNFIDPKKTYPVIATTSRLLTTGADVKTCKLIVIDKNIGSLSEFKQIIGRGTRVEEEYGKLFYTIMDFRNAYSHFYDKDYDGDPYVIYEPNTKIKKTRKTKKPVERKKQFIDKIETIIETERVIQFDKNNKPTTKSYKDLVKNKVVNEYTSLNNFINKWNSYERKTVIITELKKQGILFEELYKYVGKDYDAFDLICHIAFDQPLKLRKTRAKKLKESDYFNKYNEVSKKVLFAILDKYSDQGIEHIENIEILRLPPIDKIGSVHEIISSFGGRNNFEKSIKNLSMSLYT